MGGCWVACAFRLEGCCLTCADILQTPKTPLAAPTPNTHTPPTHPHPPNSNLLTSVAPSLLLSLYHMCVLPVLVYYAAQVRVVVGGGGWWVHHVVVGGGFGGRDECACLVGVFVGCVYVGWGVESRA
jgi:hypothetical protein